MQVSLDLSLTTGDQFAAAVLALPRQNNPERRLPEAWLQSTLPILPLQPRLLDNARASRVYAPHRMCADRKKLHADGRYTQAAALKMRWRNAWTSVEGKSECRLR